MRAVAPINFSNPADRVRHDKMVGMVGLMLTAKKELAALTDRGTEYWQRPRGPGPAERQTGE